MKANAAAVIAATVAAVTADTLTRSAAIRTVRASADALIAQAERITKGFDKGAYRDDDSIRLLTIAQGNRMESECAFALSAKFAGDN